MSDPSAAESCEERVERVEGLLREALEQIERNAAAIRDLRDLSTFYKERGDRLAARLARAEEIVARHQEIAEGYERQVKPLVFETAQSYEAHLARAQVNHRQSEQRWRILGAAGALITEIGPATEKRQLSA